MPLEEMFSEAFSNSFYFSITLSFTSSFKVVYYGVETFEIYEFEIHGSDSTVVSKG